MNKEMKKRAFLHYGLMSSIFLSIELSHPFGTALFVLLSFIYELSYSNFQFFYIFSSTSIFIIFPLLISFFYFLDILFFDILFFFL